MNHEHYYWAGFCLIKTLGPINLAKLVRFFPSGQKAWEAPKNELLKAGILEKLAEEIIAGRGQIPLKTIFSLLEKENISILPINDPLYPGILKEIPSPPAVLFYQGRLELLDSSRRNAAIVGTRKASPYGKQCAKHFAKILAEHGIAIVSGLAKGIDIEAHLGALENNGNTIAVFGTSLCWQDIFPADHKKFAKIISEKGLLLSEFPPLWPIRKENFPRRNRIVSGLSEAVIVIEAPRKSGALITARYGLDQNRDILAVPGDINKPNAQGTNELIKLGAKPITSDEDLREYLNLQDQSPAAAAAPASTEEHAILQCLQIEPLTMDELLEQTAMEFPRLTAILVSMEMNASIKNQGGRYFTA
ncbi:MAG: DNA-protecting protein DprA [Parcubacteria group bacterium]|nr:DNA-protecting protein DprA [Parcubacteria group bacterium]